MSKAYLPVLEARGAFEKARHQLEVAHIELAGTGMFQETLKEIEESIDDLSRSIDIMNRHLNSE